MSGGRKVLHPNYLGLRRDNSVKGRHARYLAPCGHESNSPHSKMCRECYLESCPHVSNGGYRCTSRSNGVRIFDHRSIAETVLGRHLRKGEVVHHVDMDKTNNAHDNLVVCTKAYHHEIHQRMQLAWARAYKESVKKKRA